MRGHCKDFTFKLKKGMKGKNAENKHSVIKPSFSLISFIIYQKKKNCFLSIGTIH